MLNLDLEARNVGDDFLLQVEDMSWKNCTAPHGLRVCEGLKSHVPSQSGQASSAKKAA